MNRRKRGGFTVIELLVVVAIFLAVTIALAPFVRMTKAWARRVECANNLRRISLGLHTYARSHGNAFPASLRELYPASMVEERAFDCPATRHAGTPDEPDYEYAAGLNERSAGRLPVVQDKDGNHGKSGKHILTVDGSVVWAPGRS